MKPYLPDDIMNMILKFRSEGLKNDKYKFTYDKVIKELNDIHAVIYGGTLIFIENESLQSHCAKVWIYSTALIINFKTYLQFP